MKTTLQGINSRLEEAEDQISNMRKKIVENTQLEQKKKKTRIVLGASGTT